MNYPPLKFDHLIHLSDTTGIQQHARWSIPDPSWGYTLDDNARAFVVALRGYIQTGDAALVEWARRYLSFMMYAQRDDGLFRNFASYDRQWLEDTGSPDSNGRALWALGYGARVAPEAGMREACVWLFDRARPHIDRLRDTRAASFTLLGCVEMHRADHDPLAMRAYVDNLAAHLAGLFERNSGQDWQWFENGLTYGNATLSQAMLATGLVTGLRRYTDIGQRSLDFLIDVMFAGDHLDLIGQNGWYMRGGRRAVFDQQPIDAGCMVEALVFAQDVLGEKRYGELADVAMAWFYGQNRTHQPIYDEDTGGCFDGLTPEGVNRNQGAESTLAHLSARLAMKESLPTTSALVNRPR